MAVRIGLIVEPTGDHLSYYFRAGQCTGVEGLAVADSSGTLTAAVAQASGRDPAAFATAGAMMREFSPQLVIISLEPHRMPAAIAAAIEGGAHVLVEKPGCVDLAGFESCVRLANRTGRQIMLAMATRLDPAAIEARRIVERGWLGSRIYGASMHWMADQTRLRNPAYQRSWKASKRLGGGGKLIFHGIHYIDLLHFLTGDRVEQVAALLANAGGQPIDVEDAAAVCMRLRSGATAILHTGYYLDRGYSNQVALWGSAGWLRFEPRKNPQLTWSSTGKGAPAGDQYYQAPTNRDSYALMLQAAVDFVLGLAPPFIDSTGSLDALSAVFSCYSAASAGTVKKL